MNLLTYFHILILSYSYFICLCFTMSWGWRSCQPVPEATPPSSRCLQPVCDAKVTFLYSEIITAPLITLNVQCRQQKHLVFFFYQQSAHQCSEYL